MKQKKQLRLMLSFLAASIILYISVSLGTDYGRKSKSADAINHTNAENEALVSIDTENINDIKWNNGTEDIEMSLEGGRWSRAEDAAFPVLQSSVDELLEKLTSAKAEIAVFKPEKLSDYGLDKAALYFELKNEKGESERLLIGNKAGAGDGYYCMRDGETEIMLMEDSIYEVLSREAASYIKTVSPQTMTAPTDMKITGKDGSVFEMFKTDEPWRYTYTNYYSWFTDTDDGIKPLDLSKSEKLAALVAGIEWKGVAAYGIDETVLKEYGLDEYAIKAEVSDGNSTISLLVGNETADNTFYAYLEGSDMICTISEGAYETLTEAGYESLKPTDVCRMSWESMTGMEISAEGEGISIESASNGKYICTEDGREVSQDAVTNFKSIIDRLASVGETEETEPESEDNVIMDIVFHSNMDGHNRLEMKIASYDEKYVIVYFNKNKGKIVSSAAADTLLKLYNQMS